MSSTSRLAWFVLPISLFCMHAFGQQPSGQAIKKFQAELLPVCKQLINEDLRNLRLSNKQSSSFCSCAVSRTISLVIKEKIQDTDRVHEKLLLDFFECGRVEIPKAISQDYQKRGLKLRAEVFDVNKSAGQCLGDFEYRAMIDAIISKAMPSRMDTEEEMARCILLK